MVLALACATAHAAAVDDAAREQLRAGTAHYAHGRFAAAAETLARAERLYAEARDAPGRIQALRLLAGAHQALGAHAQAVAVLEQALALIPDDGAEARTLLTAQLGGAQLQAGRGEQARTLLTRALAAARADHNDGLVAAILNDLGGLHRRENENEQALTLYLEAARIAATTGPPALALEAAVNAAWLQLERRDFAAVRERVAAAQTAASKVDAPYVKVRGLIRAGQILLEVARHEPAARAPTLKAAHATLDAALAAARTLGQPRLLSVAQGALAGAYLHAGQLDDALALTRQAIRAAQQSEADELLVRWHWQTGRIFRAQRQPDKALDAYRRAYAVYQGRALAPPASNEPLLPIESPAAALLELADLLLARSARVAEPAGARAYLVEARDVIEKLKARELQDYFRDSCVTEARTRVQTLEQSLDPRTAVLYPIVFADRLELLLSYGADIRRFTVAVESSVVVDTARRFRAEVERQQTLSYLPHAQALYRWLIQPIEATLAGWGVTTLVTVPDPALRAIPLAALHDGREFLIERLALALVPGLELTDPRPLPAEGLQTLLAGVTEPVQGYPALVNVKTELESIHALYGGRVLINDAFRRERLERELTAGRYAIAHIASHGEFAGDVRRSFVLSYEGRISMDELARFIGFNRVRDDPLDLLTLSACHTAAGDERAALGLAGIAVKAGARSAVASLWPIHDEATALLMAEFYRALRAPGVSKAEALQRAQRKLVGITRYRHPGYWSAFVLIGSWR